MPIECLRHSGGASVGVSVKKSAQFLGIVALVLLVFGMIGALLQVDETDLFWKIHVGLGVVAALFFFIALRFAGHSSIVTNPIDSELPLDFSLFYRIGNSVYVYYYFVYYNLTIDW